MEIMPVTSDLAVSISQKQCLKLAIYYVGSFHPKKGPNKHFVTH